MQGEAHEIRLCIVVENRGFMSEGICMEPYSFFPLGQRGRIFGILITALAICLMVVSSQGGLHYDPFSCYGLLGAGFTASFLCDYSDGGNPVFLSPAGSAEKLDDMDFPYFSLQGVVVNILFYIYCGQPADVVHDDVWHPPGAAQDSHG